MTCRAVYWVRRGDFEVSGVVVTPLEPMDLVTIPSDEDRP